MATKRKVRKRVSAALKKWLATQKKNSGRRNAGGTSRQLHAWDVFAGDPGFSAQFEGQVKAATKAEAIALGRSKWGEAPHGPGGRMIRQTIAVKKRHYLPGEYANPGRRNAARGVTLRNMASVTIKRLPGGAVAVTGRKLAGR